MRLLRSGAGKLYRGPGALLRSGVLPQATTLTAAHKRQTPGPRARGGPPVRTFENRTITALRFSVGKLGVQRANKKAHRYPLARGGGRVLRVDGLHARRRTGCTLIHALHLFDSPKTRVELLQHIRSYFCRRMHNMIALIVIFKHCHGMPVPTGHVGVV